MIELEPFLDTLRALPFVRVAKAARASPANGRNVDGILKLTTPSGATSLIFEVKAGTIRAPVAATIAHRLQDPRASLVLAAYIDPKAAQLFAEKQINYVDLEGNCRLAIGDRYLAHIEKQGAPSKSPEERAWRPASYRALFALLAAPETAAATTRELAKRAGGLSPQTAADVLAKLKANEILLATRTSTRWAPGGYKRALDLWIHGFQTVLRPALAIGTYRWKERDTAAIETHLSAHLEKLTWAWGGGAACQRLTSYYRGERTVVYLQEPPSGLSASLRLVPDAQGPIALLHVPGPFAFFDDEKHVVHPLLVHADLLAEHESRARDAANEIYDDYIRATEQGT